MQPLLSLGVPPLCLRFWEKTVWVWGWQQHFLAPFHPFLGSMTGSDPRRAVSVKPDPPWRSWRLSFVAVETSGAAKGRYPGCLDHEGRLRGSASDDDWDLLGLMFGAGKAFCLGSGFGVKTLSSKDIKGATDSFLLDFLFSCLEAPVVSGVQLADHFLLLGSTDL